MKSKYWLMNSEIMGCNISQSLSKKISQNFNGIKYECECGKTHGVIHDMVDSLDILCLRCDDCAIVYFDEEQMDELSEDHITKLSNVCDYRQSEKTPNYNEMQRTMHVTMHERYGIKATPEKPTIRFTGQIQGNPSLDNKKKLDDKKKDALLKRLEFLGRNSLYGMNPEKQKIQMASLYGTMGSGNKEKK